MFGGVVGDNMKRMKRREKQENKNIFKMMFPPKKLKLMRVSKDWVMLLYFVLDGYSTLWWIMFIFHNFLQNNISDKLQNLQVDFRSSSSKFFFFFLSKHMPKFNLLYLRSSSNTKGSFMEHWTFTFRNK